MDYVINKETILSKVEELIARIADSRYADDGTSLYDSIVTTSGDSGVLESYIDEAISNIVARLADVCVSSSGYTLSFNVPDMVEGNITRAKSELDSYIVNTAVSLWCDKKDADSSVLYQNYAANDLNAAIKLMKTRKIPSRK